MPGNFDVSRQATFSPLPTGASSCQYDTTNEDPFATLLFSTPLQVFNRNQGNIAAARQELAAAVTQQKQVELRLTARLAAIFRQYESARSLAEIQSTSIQPKARQSLELVQQAYEARGAPDIDLLTTQRTFLQAVQVRLL